MILDMSQTSLVSEKIPQQAARRRGRRATAPTSSAMDHTGMAPPQFQIQNNFFHAQNGQVNMMNQQQQPAMVVLTVRLTPTTNINTQISPVVSALPMAWR